MPIYDFKCTDCPKSYEDFVRSFDQSGIFPDVKCPACSSTNKKLVPSVPAPAVFANKAGTSKMDNFEYRAGYNMDKAQGERRHAESASHMGQTPYNSIDDITSGKNFGEVQ